MLVDRKFVYYRYKPSDIEDLVIASASYQYMDSVIDQAEGQHQSPSFVGECRGSYIREKKLGPVCLIDKQSVTADSRQVLTGIASQVFNFRRAWTTAVNGVRESLRTTTIDIGSQDSLTGLLLTDDTANESLSAKIEEILAEVDFSDIPESKQARERQKLARAICLLCTETRRDIRQAVVISRMAKQKDKLDQDSIGDTGLSPAQVWNGKAKESRSALNTNDTKLFTAWIFYLKMLIGGVLGENFQFTDNEEFTRRDLILEYLGSIFSDCLSQSIVVANSCHARQDSSRLRHTGHAYMNHCREVAEEAAFAILPFYFAKAMNGASEDLKRAVVMAICIAIIGPIHDVVEDVKEWDVDALITDIVSRVNTWDTVFATPLMAIDAYRKTHSEQAYQSKGLEDLKKELHLITEESLIKALKLIERILSKGTETNLSDEEKEIILKQNLAGQKATLDLLALSDDDLSRFKDLTSQMQEEPDGPFFREYVGYDRKMTTFVVREHGMPEALRTTDSVMADIVRYVSLCYKLIDRKNNLATVLQVNIDRPSDAFRILRTSYEDIVRYALALYPIIGEPMDLFNALPMLLEKLLEVYKQARDGVELEGYGRFDSRGEYDAEIDGKFIEEIEKLVQKYPIRELPEIFRARMDEKTNVVS